MLCKEKNDKNKKLSVPFFYTDPIAEKGIYPIKGLIWFVYICISTLFFFFFIDQYIQERQFPTGIVLCMVFVIFGLGIIGLFTRDILDELFFDHITIEDNSLIYKGSKVFSNVNNHFKINSESKIVWTVKRTTNNAIENSLYIVDAECKRHLLIDKVRLYIWAKSWEKFITEFSKVTGLKVEKEIKNT